MGKIVQTEALPPQKARRPIAGATIAALGVVYGDIGTSPLYALKQAVAAGGTPTPDAIAAWHNADLGRPA